MTFGYQFVSIPLRILPRAALLSTWLRAFPYELTTTSLTPFFPPLAHPTFNPHTLYLLQQTGGRVPRSYQSWLALLSPARHSPALSDVEGSLACPPQLQRRLAGRHSPLSPFARSLTRKQGGTRYWPALSTVEGLYQSAKEATRLGSRLLSLLRTLRTLRVSAVSLLLFLFVPPSAVPCPTSRFPLKCKHPFPVITGENQ